MWPAIRRPLETSLCPPAWDARSPAWLRSRLTTDAKARSTPADAHGRGRRRSERVLLRIPVILYGLTRENQHVSQEAETAIVSRHGALLRSRLAFKAGGTLELTNNFSKDAEEFRVISVSEEQKEGMFDLAVEMLRPRDDFWGITFPTRTALKT